MVRASPPLTPWRILRVANPPCFELYSSLYAILWGVWLANPSNQTFTNSPAWDAVATVASELVWGISLILIGIAHLIALYYRNRRGRQATAFIMGVAMGIFGYAFFEYARSGLTWIGYWSVALGQFWCVARFRGWLKDPDRLPI
jgi:hypothetical protein